MKLENLVQTLQLLTLLQEPKLIMSATNGNSIPTVKLIFNNVTFDEPQPDLITIVTDERFKIVDIVTDDVLFTDIEADLSLNMQNVAWVTEKACFQNLMCILTAFYDIKTKQIDSKLMLPEKGLAYVTNNYEITFNSDVFVATLIHHSFNSTLKFKGNNLHLGDWIIPDWYKWYNGTNPGLPMREYPITTGSVMEYDLLS